VCAETNDRGDMRRNAMLIAEENDILK